MVPGTARVQNAGGRREKPGSPPDASPGMSDATTGEEFRDDLRAPGPSSATGVPQQRMRLLVPAELAPLMQLDARRSALAVGGTLLAIGAIGASGVAFWPAPPGVALAVVLMAAQQHALFVLAHDAAHYRLFSSRRANDLAGRLAGTLGGVSMCTYRVTHRLHHNHLYGTQDPDLALHGGYPRGRMYLVRKLLVDLSGWTAPKTYAYFFGAPAVNADTQRAQRPLDDTSASLRAAARRDRRGVLAFHALAPIVAAALGGWTGLAQYLVLWTLPMVTILQALLRLRAIAEHGAPAGYDSALRAARTNLPGAGLRGTLVRTFFFPHHVNYHIEHHLYPGVPHYRLPDLHRLLRERGLLDDAEVRDFGATLQRVFGARGSVPEAIGPATG